MPQPAVNTQALRQARNCLAEVCLCNEHEPHRFRSTCRDAATSVARRVRPSSEALAPDIAVNLGQRYFLRGFFCTRIKFPVARSAVWILDGGARFGAHVFGHHLDLRIVG